MIGFLNVVVSIIVLIFFLLLGMYRSECPYVGRICSSELDIPINVELNGISFLRFLRPDFHSSSPLCYIIVQAMICLRVYLLVCSCR
jgi:hypothetical protein